MCGEPKRSGPTRSRIRINADTAEPACIGGAKLARMMMPVAGVRIQINSLA